MADASELVTEAQKPFHATVLGDPAPWQVYTKQGPPPIGVLRFQAWKQQIQLEMRHRWGNREPLKGPITIYATFYRPWPRTAPQKNPVACMRWADEHILKKPDVTNYLKAFEDALKDIVFFDDAQTIEITGRKTYASIGYGGYTEIQILGNREGGMTCCEHPKEEHGQERIFYECDDSKREVCLLCPGYEVPGYPNGKAWHRFKPDTGGE